MKLTNEDLIHLWNKVRIEKSICAKEQVWNQVSAEINYDVDIQVCNPPFIQIGNQLWRQIYETNK